MSGSDGESKVDGTLEVPGLIDRKGKIATGDARDGPWEIALIGSSTCRAARLARATGATTGPPTLPLRRRALDIARIDKSRVSPCAKLQGAGRDGEYTVQA